MTKINVSGLRMEKLGYVIACVVYLSLVSPFATAAENDWLVGKWEMTFDPDGDEKDWLEFTADGLAFSISAKGKRIPGRYRLVEPKIYVTYTLNGKNIPISLEYTPDKKKLLALSERTGGKSEYRKVN